MGIIPYLSEKQFNILYSSLSIGLHLKTTELDNSFFEVLMSGYTLQYPQFSGKYYLLSEILPNKDSTTYKRELTSFNSFLERNDLLLREHQVKPTLKDLIVNSINRILEEEAEMEIISFEDIETIENSFFMLAVSEFIIQANRHYPKEEIKKFLLKEFNLTEDNV